MKLSKGQEKVLRLMADKGWHLRWSSLNGGFELGDWYKVNANTADSLIRRGYIKKATEWWNTRYEISDAGREALSESSPAGGR